ncbi:GABRB3 [Branchiostoma lanceolatum]|uniref:Gamma-aminobutyric acid receptor subunit pi n=1 Tax=Branchiostoma lanceolatum TaxID=7740 RepID=A0A8J9ZVW6_BRALA|nr:GABRB3 [Branchiostoma lanceolatum]
MSAGMAFSYCRVYLCLCTVYVGLDVSGATFPGSQNNSSAKFFSTTTPTTSAIENLLKGYDRNLRPNFGGPAVDVLVSMQIASIDQISEVDLDYTITVFLRQYWRDNRLQYTGTNKSLSLDGRLVEKLWVPDTFLVNSKSSFLHRVTVDNRLIRIEPNGNILYGMRITAKIACPMDLRKYPLDEQNCTMELESYGYTTNEVTYDWKNGSASVQGLLNLELSQFTLVSYDTVLTKEVYETGTYARLSFSFLLCRNILYFILQTYLPAILLVIVSWVSFWINHESVPARIALGITTVLTMTTVITGAKSSLPKISYIKAIDVYLGMCFLFTFAALLEYAAVNFEASSRTRRETKSTRKLLQKMKSAKDGKKEGNEEGTKAKRFPLMAKKQAVKESPKDEQRPSTENNSQPAPAPRQVKCNQTLKRIVLRTTADPNHVDRQPPPEPQHNNGTNVDQVEDLGQTENGPTPVARKRPNLRKRPTLSDVAKRVVTNRSFAIKVKDVATIDKYSRVLFPLTFALLNVAYWIGYLT